MIEAKQGTLMGAAYAKNNQQLADELVKQATDYKNSLSAEFQSAMSGIARQKMGLDAAINNLSTQPQVSTQPLPSQSSGGINPIFLISGLIVIYFLIKE